MEWIKRGTSKKDDKRQTANAEVQGSNPDRVYAILRRLKSEIIELRSEVSTCRRDINRIERKQSRDNELKPLHELSKRENGGGAPAPARRFGI